MATVSAHLRSFRRKSPGS